MIVAYAYMPIKPEARERWLSIADAVTGPSRAEDACRSYRIYEDIETPNSFISLEEWENMDGIHHHFHTPHFTEFVTALAGVLAGPPDGSVHEVASTLTLNDALATGGASG